MARLSIRKAPGGGLFVGMKLVVLGCIAGVYGLLFLAVWWAERRIASGAPGWGKDYHG